MSHQFGNCSFELYSFLQVNSFTVAKLLNYLHLYIHNMCKLSLYEINETNLEFQNWNPKLGKTRLLSSERHCQGLSVHLSICLLPTCVYFHSSNNTSFHSNINCRAGSRIFRRVGRGPIFGGFWPPTWALFSENVCKNKRIGSCRGPCTGTPPPLDPPMN